MKKTHKPYVELEEFLKANNINLMEIACTLSISLTTLYNKLKGRSDFSITEAVVLVDKYNVPLDLFYNEG